MDWTLFLVFGPVLVLLGVESFFLKVTKLIRLLTPLTSQSLLSLIQTHWSFMMESRNGRIYNVMVLFVEILLTGQIWKFEKFVGVGVFQLLDLLSLIFQNRIDSIILRKWPVLGSLRRQGSASLRVLRHGHASHCLVHPESARFWLLGKVLYFVKWLFTSKVSSDLLVKTAIAEEASGVVRHVLITWTAIVAAIRYRTCDPTWAFDKHRLFIFGGAHIFFRSRSRTDLLQYIFIFMML